MMTTRMQRMAPAMATVFTSWVVSCFRWVSSGVMSWRALPILPISVVAPIAVAFMRLRPWTTRVPEKTQGRSSPPGGCGGDVPSHSHLRTGMDSPVSRDSSTQRLAQKRMVPSAGTRSPSCRRMMSSRTTSRPGMRCCMPSRMTRARGLLRLRRASRARSVFRCW